MARPTREEARDTRRLILDAALELFAEGGFAGTSMRQIARAVGVRESALYHHFESKAAIFEALVLELGPGKMRRFDALDLDASLAGGPEPLLRSFARLLMEESARPREQKFIRLMLAEAPRLKDAGVLHNPMLTGMTYLTGVFEALARRGAIRPGDPELHAVEFMGPLVLLRLSYLVLAEGPPDMERLFALVDAHVRHFHDSVRPKEGTC